MPTHLKALDRLEASDPLTVIPTRRPTDIDCRTMRRLVVFSDPGGAKPCLSLAQKWRVADDVLVCSDRQYAFFETFGIPVRAARDSDAPSILDEFRPHAIYTGTSYTSCIEIAFVCAALNRRIHSASFVDHYTGFATRFGSGASRILPDEIHVVDERARAAAAEAGLPLEIIRITGNPYHDFLRGWRSPLNKAQVFERLGIHPTEAKTILFAPDPLSNAGGVDAFGTDEVATSRLLLRCLREAAQPFQVLVKAHPNQSLDYLLSGLDDVPPNVNLHVVRPESDAFLNDLIQHVDLVAGMISNLLSEAEAMGKATLRIEIGFRDAIIHCDRRRGVVSHANELKDRVTTL